jgi:acyl transferase domain-containing protein
VKILHKVFMRQAEIHTTRNQSPPNVLLLSADDKISLVETCKRLLSSMYHTPGLSDLICTWGRNAFRSHRLALVIGSHNHLYEQIVTALVMLEDSDRPFRTPTGIYYGFGHEEIGVVAMFPGLGSTYPGMIAELSQVSYIIGRWFVCYKETLLHFRPECQARSGVSISTDDGTHERISVRDDDAHAGVIASLALHDLCRHLLIPLDFYLGHSNGEHAALIASGAVDLPDIETICNFVAQIDTSAFLTGERDEAMIAVSGLSLDIVQRAVATLHNVFIACDNCSKQIVIAGRKKGIELMASHVRQLGGQFVFMPGLRAHHTPCFEDGRTTLRREYGRWPFRAPRRPLYSCYLADAVRFEESEVAEIISQQWTNTVKFRDTIRTLYQRGAHVFLDIGPGSHLRSMVDDILRGQPHVASSLSSRDRPERHNINRFLAELYAGGVPFDVERVDHLIGDDIGKE